MNGAGGGRWFGGVVSFTGNSFFKVLLWFIFRVCIGRSYVKYSNLLSLFWCLLGKLNKVVFRLLKLKVELQCR